MTGRPRVAALMGTIFPHQHAVLAEAGRLGAAVTLVGSRTNPYEGKWPWHVGAPAGTDAIFVDPLHPLRGREYAKWWYPRLGRILRRLEPDIVHVLTEPWTPFALNALVALARLRPRPRLCIHGVANIYEFGPPVQRLMRNALSRAVLARVSGFVSWNREGIDLAREHGLAAGAPWAVIPAIVPDTATFVPLGEPERLAVRAELGLPLDEVVLGFIGRLESEKGLADILDALRKLSEAAPYFAVWGDGRERERLGDVRRDGPVRGHVGRPLGPAAVARALAACDILVVPSRTTPAWKEQFGRIAVEGMLAGVPVVAYDSGALPDVVGAGGVLVAEGDVARLAEAIGRLANPTLRAETGARGRRWALERFAPEPLAAQLVEFWRAVIAA